VPRYAVNSYFLVSNKLVANIQYLSNGAKYLCDETLSFDFFLKNVGGKISGTNQKQTLKVSYPERKKNFFPLSLYQFLTEGEGFILFVISPFPQTLRVAG